MGAGEVAYRSLMAAPYVLRQPVRQDVACPLYRELMDARNGCIAMDPPDAPAPPAGVRFWNSLGRTFLDKAQLANFDLAKESVLYLACKRKRKAAVNAEYMATLPAACVMRAQCTGPHSFDDNEQVNKGLGRLKAIPRTNVLAVGGSVKLLTNISPERGLANGARGHVRDIIYPPDPVTGAAGGYSKPPPGGDTTTWPVCIVEFPTYTGEVVVPGHPTFVPICAMTMNCGSANGKCQKCTRHGLPLGCGAPRVGRWPPRTPRRSLPARRRAHGSSRAACSPCRGRARRLTAPPAPRQGGYDPLRPGLQLRPGQAADARRHGARLRPPAATATRRALDSVGLRCHGGAPAARVAERVPMGAGGVRLARVGSGFTPRPPSGQSRWPGSFYTGTSRAMSPECLAPGEPAEQGRWGVDRTGDSDDQVAARDGAARGPRRHARGSAARPRPHVRGGAGTVRRTRGRDDGSGGGRGRGVRAPWGAAARRRRRGGGAGAPCDAAARARVRGAVEAGRAAAAVTRAVGLR